MTSRWQTWGFAALLATILSLANFRAEGQSVQDPPFGRPDALVDLASREGVQLVNGQWRYHDVRIVSASHAVGPDLKPSGVPIRTYDYTPHAGPADFDDSQWEAIDATTLDQRRSTAKVCFNWYRINVTIPEKVGGFNTAGSTVAFEIVIDDYAEVWVNGKMPRVLGQPGGPVIKGFNAPNRVILTRNAQPGQQIQLAVFGINGPISDSPENFIWAKSATLDFYKSPKVAVSESPAQVTRKDSALDDIVPAGAKIEKLAGGFLFTEGPIWVPRSEETDGYLLFSDPNNAGTDLLRQRKPSEPLEEGQGDEGFRPRQVQKWAEDPERLLAASQMNELVREAVLRLPEKYRIAVLLRDINQLSTEEAAAALDLSVPALKARVLRGRLMLRESLAPHFIRKDKTDA
ncbi:MAG: sigma factor-like helix-turn-helix DNA-binding protein [Candidatus Sulfotelmatobacter sp.]